MNIYLISQDVNNNYDTYDSAIVCANTEKEAQYICPDEYYTYHDGSYYYQYSNGTEKVENGCYPWCDPKYVKVKLIGVADKSIEKGVICASFNAG